VIWSLGLAVIFALAAFFTDKCEHNILFIFACLVSAPLGLVFGIVSIFKIKKSKGQLKGMGFAIGGVTIHLIFTVVIIIMIYVIIGILPENRRFMCHQNLSLLGKCLKLYSENNQGFYSLADKWCDLLKSEAGLPIPDQIFVCPSSNTKKGLCDYAMNSDVEPNSSGDVVLLFEAKEGWNQHGGG